MIVPGGGLSSCPRPCTQQHSQLATCNKTHLALVSTAVCELQKKSNGVEFCHLRAWDLREGAAGALQAQPQGSWMNNFLSVWGFCCNGKDRHRRMDARQLHRPCFAYYAGSANKTCGESIQKEQVINTIWLELLVIYCMMFVHLFSFISIQQTVTVTSCCFYSVSHFTN